VSQFARFLTAIRKSRDVSVESIATTASVSTKTVYRWLSGQMLPSNPQLDKILLGLDLSQDDVKTARRLYDESALSRTSPLDLELDSEAASLRVAPLKFPPFSGSPDAFMERFLESMLNLAGIAVEVPDFAQIREGDAQPFEISDRVRWLDEKRVDIVPHLASLQRLKKIAFLLTPIRVSLNAVILRVQDEIRQKELLQNAQRLLTQTEKTPTRNFRLIAVSGEVGAVYLERSLKIDRKRISFMETLDAGKLADSLTSSSELPGMVVVDEMSAFALIQQLQGKGMLVFPPSTDQAMLKVAHRSELPIHHLGFGLHRLGNSDLINYIDEAAKQYLAAETERVAILYEKLYNDQVAYLEAALAQTYSYKGAIRIDWKSFRPDGESPSTDDDSSSVGINLWRNARLIARRCLNLTTTAIAELPLELSSWKQVLKRTDQRIQISESSDRSHIKLIIKDLLRFTSHVLPGQPQGRPLRGGIKPSHEEKQNDQDLWEHFLSHLEQSFNFKVPGEQYPEMRESFYSAGVEGLVSIVQKMMRSVANEKDFISVRKVEVTEKRFSELFNTYKLKHPELASRKDPDRKGSSRVPTINLLASELGDPLGFLQANIVTISKDLSLYHARHLFRVEDALGAGVTRKLIDGLINEAAHFNNMNADSGPQISKIYFFRDEATPAVQDAFLRSGFVEKGDEFYYELG